MKKYIVFALACLIALVMGGTAFGGTKALINGPYLQYSDDSANYTTLKAGSVSGDVVLTLPTTSGKTVATTDGATFTSTTLTSPTITLGTDAQVYVANSAGTMSAVTMSGDVTITNAGVASLEAGSDGQMFIYNATEKWGPKTLSGDATITNAGVMTIGNNKIGTAEANLNSVSLVIASGTAFNTATVESGSTMLGVYPASGGATAWLNSADFTSTTLTLTVNATLGSDKTYTVIFLRP